MKWSRVVFCAACGFLALCMVTGSAWTKGEGDADKRGVKKNPATAARPGNAYIKRGQWFGWHKQHAVAAKKGKLDVIFIGDSITYLWTRNAKGIWKKYYGTRKAAAFGIPADRTEQVLWRVQRCNLESSGAKVLVLLVGTNNLGTKPVCTGQQIGEALKAIVNVLRKKCPKAHVIVTGIFPRGKPAGPKANKWVNDQVGKANEIAAGVADGKLVHFVDIGPKMVGKNGKVDRQMIFDGVHITGAGYEAWAKATEPLISTALGDTPRGAKNKATTKPAVEKKPAPASAPTTKPS